MPPGSRLEELPEPKSPKINMREITGHQVAVVRFSGVADAGTIKEKTEHLLGVLSQDGVKIRSTPITALYNRTPPSGTSAGTYYSFTPAAQTRTAATLPSALPISLPGRPSAQ